MKRFWLIRHGQSTANAGEPIEARGLPPLTPLGRKQAQIAADFFPVEPDLIVTSPFVRTKQTAEPLQARFPAAAHDEWPVQEFTGLAAHLYINTTGVERIPHIQAFWEREDPHYRQGDGAETFAETIYRADTLLDQLTRSPYERIAVFTHGMFLRFLFWRWLVGSAEQATQDMAAFRALRPIYRVPNCAIIHGTISDDGVIMLTPVQTIHSANAL